MAFGGKKKSVSVTRNIDSTTFYKVSLIFLMSPAIIYADCQHNKICRVDNERIRLLYFHAIFILNITSVELDCNCCFVCFS